MDCRSVKTALLDGCLPVDLEGQLDDGIRKAVARSLVAYAACVQPFPRVPSRNGEHAGCHWLCQCPTFKRCGSPIEPGRTRSMAARLMGSGAWKGSGITTNFAFRNLYGIISQMTRFTTRGQRRWPSSLRVMSGVSVQSPIATQCKSTNQNVHQHRRLRFRRPFCRTLSRILLITRSDDATLANSP